MNSQHSSRRRIEEPHEIALKTLLHFLAKRQFGDLKRYLQWDFFTKLYNAERTIRPESKAAYLQRFITLTEPQAVPTTMTATPLPTYLNKDFADVAFIAILKEELVALKTALGISIDKAEDYSVRGMRCWRAQLTSSTQVDPINVVVTMVGAARTLECAAAMSTFFTHHMAGLCILVGIAAGLKKKTTIGDVVAAYDMVLDYEGQRLEPAGPKKRPKPYPLHPLIKRDLEYFSPVRTDWLSQFQSMLPKLQAEKLIPSECSNWLPKYHTGVILAGEKLVADGSLPAMQRDFSEKVRAVEQEGSGFARICNEQPVPWLVFRGVSDYGERRKPNEFQVVAALAAATCAVAFVKSDYRFSGSAKAEEF